MKFLERFKITKMKKKAKYVAGLIASAALLSLAIFPVLSMNADGPRFNFMENDHELMQGLNKTQGEENWKDPVGGVAGDTFAVNIYYHNGMVDTTAVNTKIKAMIPSQTTNNVAVLSSSVSADNAAAVSDTLTVNLDRNADLALVPGSVEWRPDAGPNNNQIFPLPNGQTGNEITSANGINLGDIQGCWDFAGFVSFLVKTTPRAIPTSDLSLTKAVRNVSDGQDAFVKTTGADQSEKVEFRINVKNNGEGSSEEVFVRDSLPTELLEIPGSGRIVINGSTNPINLGDFLTDGINLGAFAPNALASIYFEAVAPGQIFVAKTVVNNVYLTSGDQDLLDSASVVLEPGLAFIDGDKSAYNETQGIDATLRAANAGDIITYTLNTRNTGTLATSIRVIDDIADVLEYATVTNISDHGILENAFIKYPEFVIQPGMEVTDHFTVRVKDPIPANPQNGYSFDRVMFNEYFNDVIIPVNVPVLAPALSIDKLVRNVTTNELTFVNANTANAGDTLEYKISFRNNGNGPADSVKIYDVLPANVSLDTAVPAIIYLNGQERSISENILDGFRIITLAPGQEGYVRFRAVISSGIAGDQKLVNTGYLEDDGVVFSDIAETVTLQKVIKVAAPVVTLPRSGGANEIVALIAALVVTFGLVLTVKKVRA